MIKPPGKPGIAIYFPPQQAKGTSTERNRLQVEDHGGELSYAAWFLLICSLAILGIPLPSVFFLGGAGLRLWGLLCLCFCSSLIEGVFLLGAPVVLGGLSCRETK